MTVTAASGFRASSTACGIKPTGLDIALVAAGRPVPVAAVFTSSLAAAPPVRISRRRSRSGIAQAVLLNSGSANAATGLGGEEDALVTSGAVASSLGCTSDQVLICSTGPIGTRLPTGAMLEAIPRLVSELGSDGSGAAHAILTTDTVAKQATVQIGEVAVGGMAKGAGMLRPDMATMLAVLTTDARVEAPVLRTALGSAVDETFNCLNVDGCQSTNDTVILLASGEAGSIDEAQLTLGVTEVCRSLARMMAMDAEGAHRVVDIRVEGAASRRDARIIGRSICDSALVRSSFWGGDPNWGRVLAAAAVAGAPFDPTEVRIAYQGVTVCDAGIGVPFDEPDLTMALSGDFEIEVRVGAGPGAVDILTTDLTPDYVRFNGERS